MREARWGGFLAIGVVVALAACEGGTADDDGAVDVIVAPDTGAPVGTGPAAACGGVRVGDWLSGEGAGSPGDDALTLRLSDEEAVLDFIAREEGANFLFAYVGDATPARLAWSEDRLAVTITNGNGASGTLFEAVNNAFGGPIQEGRLCFDAAPASGQPLAGSFVFVVYVDTGRLLYRVQGTFAVPGTAVEAGTGSDGTPTLSVAASTGATITVD